MKSSLQKRLLVYVLCLTTLFLLVISVINYWWAHDLVVDLSEKRALASADAAAARIQGYLRQKGQNAWTLAQNEQIHAFVKKVSSQEVDLATDPTYQQMLTSFQRIVEENSDISFVYVAVEETQRLYGNIEFTYPKNYDVTKRPWYQLASKTKGMVYTAPYICPLTGNYVATASTAFYDENGEVLGVASVDISVDEIRKIVSDVHIFNNDYAFLLDADGEIVTNLKDDHYRNSIKELKNALPQMQPTFSQMINGQRGMTRVELSHIDKYVLYSPVEDIGWSMGFVVPVAEVTSSIYDLARIFFITLVIGIVVISLLVNYFTSRITEPINSFSRLMEKVGEGNYSLRAEIVGDDEIGQLGVSLNTMLDKQQAFIEQVVDTSFKMCMAGKELAITIGEARITLPMVTVNMGHVLANTEAYLQLPDDQRNIDCFNHELSEEVILLMHAQRSISSRFKDIQVLLQAEDFYLDQVKQSEVISALKEIETQWRQSNTLVENIQLGLTDLNALINRLARNYEDMQNTLDKVSKSLGVLADLQSDSIDRATQTATELVEWSQILIEHSAFFRIKGN